MLKNVVAGVVCGLLALTGLAKPAQGWTVCVFNKSKRNMKAVGVRFTKKGYVYGRRTACKLRYQRLGRHKGKMWICRGGSKAQMRLKWKGYKESWFNFRRASRREKCYKGNSLTILKAKPGYQFKVRDGKP